MRRCVHELTPHNEGRIEVYVYPCNALQPCTIRFEGCAGTRAQTISESQAPEVRAATNEVGVCVIDGHLTDIWELGAFAFESRRYGTPVTDTQ